MNKLHMVRLVVFGGCFLFVSLAYASAPSISGTVKDSAGAPFKGAFVRARRNKITMSVLSDRQGRYRIQNLPAGEYEVEATVVGYKSVPRTGVNLAAGQSATLDFALQKSMVRWSDLSYQQARVLLPEGKGRAVLVDQCFRCHGFQTRMVGSRRNQAGWGRAVTFMRTALHFYLAGRVNDQEAADVTSYMNTVFGADSQLPRSPADLPKYQETVRPFSDEAMKIVYVDYEAPRPNSWPWSETSDKDGNIWIAYYGKANRIGRLDPRVGEIQDFPVPYQGTAAIHSVVAAADGTAWFTEQGPNKIGKWDPTTQKITEYQDAYIRGKEGIVEGGSKHTVRVDPKGFVWSTGSPLTRLDPKPGKFTRFPEVPSAYGIVFDKEGNPWFTEFELQGKIGKVDAKTGKVTKWAPPTPECWPKRIQIDSNGIVWFGEYARTHKEAAKIARFDPKTQTFKEFPLPGPSATPYGLGIDRNNFIWYSSEDMDILGRLDPKTGVVIEFPFPYSENGIRELNLDSEGRMWFGTGPNNKVGYFIPPEGM